MKRSEWPIYVKIDRRNMLVGLGAVLAVPALPVTSFANTGGLRIVATTGMIADTTRQILGDLGEVVGLMGPGIDPHAYRQTRTDILAMARADIVLWNGLYLEAQMEDFLHDLERKTPVVAVAEAVAIEDRVAHDDYADRFDPHVWMDPVLWQSVVGSVRDALISIAPEHEATFTENAAVFTKQVEEIGAYATEILATVPEDARVLVTAHDAFNYFGRAYGFDVVGIQGISTESEAGISRISSLVDMIVEREIGAVFVESSVSDRSIRALIEGAAAKGHDLKIGGELFSDAMGSPGTYEGTYLGMIDHNATVIASALGGVAPERGFAGKLSAGS
ncbi:MAG: zinc ABC transporter substrate-binding protein [Boseongicola sp.]|nr:zinc ABC transporter substrate-binding protein [Boseongicola sp.]MDD9978845.1 zinc ABC transporter substrate-binding protein [Boseongicola sp.]